MHAKEALRTAGGLMLLNQPLVVAASLNKSQTMHTSTRGLNESTMCARYLDLHRQTKLLLTDVGLGLEIFEC